MRYERKPDFPHIKRIMPDVRSISSCGINSGGFWNLRSYISLYIKQIVPIAEADLFAMIVVIADDASSKVIKNTLKTLCKSVRTGGTKCPVKGQTYISSLKAHQRPGV